MPLGDEFQGSKRVTCREAMKLINEGKVGKAWFRPDKIVSPVDPDNDPAYVWLNNDNGKEKV